MKVTDPALLAELNGSGGAPAGRRKVSDPALLAALNAGERIDGAFMDAERQAPAVSRSRATLEGAGDAMSFGFGDEIGAALDLPISALAGGAGEQYSKNLARRRMATEVSSEERPGYFMGGQVAGALATAPLMPGAGGVGLGARIAQGAKAGAIGGAAYGVGSGETVGERITGGVTGGATGAMFGAAVPVAIRGAQGLARGARNVYDEVAGTARGALNRDAEAARRIGQAVKSDNLSPRQKMMTQADEATATANNQPIINMDRGGVATQRLGRAASNLSPEAGIELRAATQDRWNTAGDRVSATVRRIAGGETSDAARQRLVAEAAAQNRPAYRMAFTRPSAQSIWDQDLEGMAGAPVVQQAIRQAAVTGRNKAAAQGFPPMRSPFVVDPQTQGMRLRANPDGSIATPTLQFWDAVKKNLDSINNSESRSAAKVLREHLDTIVPEYKAARSGAAQYFQAEDAVEAGEMFINSRMSNEEGRRAFAKLNPAEKKLFGESFADAMVRKVAEIQKAGGRGRDVINAAFLSSKASRERIEIAIGREKAKELEAFLRVEYLMDRARNAISGNSTTAQQMVDLGIGGAGAGYGLYTGDWKTAGGIIGAALIKSGRRSINAKVAERIGEMLASPDPAVVHRGIRMIANNGRLIDALRAADIPLAITGGQQGAGVAMRFPIGTVPAAADENDRQSPRMRDQ